LGAGLVSWTCGLKKGAPLFVRDGPRFSGSRPLFEIQVDRGDGKGWAVLTFDTTPGYLDTTPFPAALTKWKYRAIYRVDDHQVGQWSAEASVSVGG
jgi:hypothetical protein